MVHSLVGQPAPFFSVPDSNGETYNFSPGLRGVPIALFFYPKSGAKACTIEACQFQTLTEGETFNRAGVQIVGISRDSVEKQKSFVEKNKLTFKILSDEGGEARKAYGVGKFLFIPSTRTTFIIDKKGVVRAALDNMINHNAHAKFAHKELDKLAAEDKEDGV